MLGDTGTGASMRKLLLSALAVASILTTGVSASKASQILVGQCIDGATCWSSDTPTPWSDSLTAANLGLLGLGTTQDFIANQTSPYVIQLGVTSIAFDTTGAPVTETLPEFTGTNFNIVGTFDIPSDALSAVISGTFGNSSASNSAGVNLCLGSGDCGAVAATPLPATWLMLLSGFVGLGFFAYVGKKKDSSLLTAV